MRRNLIVLFLLFVFMSGLRSENTKLVSYFSATGTTKAVAERIAQIMNADLWEIEAFEPYTDADLNWRDSLSRASIEYGDPTYRPTIKICTNIRPYDIIFLGFPIWWNTCPRIIQSWIDNNDLSDKTIIVFATSSSSPIEQSLRDLRETYPQYNWFRGGVFHSVPTLDALKKWKEDLEERLSQVDETLAK